MFQHVLKHVLKQVLEHGLFIFFLYGFLDLFVPIASAPCSVRSGF
jgi:hypothetical protein